MLPTQMSLSMSGRANELFEDHRDQLARRTDRLFAYLMLCQFLGGIAAALFISPFAWQGSQSRIHLHVWVAVLLGGIIASVPVCMAMYMPGRLTTRLTIGIGQMLTSGLLIHLTGGRIETHFHVFGSLAFLAVYRDWRVFIPATVVVGLDHLIRGLYWPESVYGVLTATPWRSLEHAGWVVFENIFLIRSCLTSVREMHEIAEKRAHLENTNAVVEEEVRQRTAELSAQAVELRQEISERKRAEAEREELHRQLMAASRQAGMAEVATGVLHNVGNVLNSVNVSTGLVVQKVRQSDAVKVSKIADLLQQNAADLGGFITTQERGRLIPQFLCELGKHLVEEQGSILGELESLTKNIDHIKHIVNMQQSYARVSDVLETAKLVDLVEDSIRLTQRSVERHNIRLVREYEDVESVNVDKQKVLQILVNLISNAKQSLNVSDEQDKVITLRIKSASVGGDHVRIEVIDNGVGIASQNMTRIFNYGFTTKKKGHGFGLHSCCLAAKAMDGSLTLHSDGPGCGATFALELPTRRKSMTRPDDGTNFEPDDLNSSTRRFHQTSAQAEQGNENEGE